MSYELDIGDGFQLSARVAAAHEGRERGLVLIPVDEAGWKRWTGDDFQRMRKRAEERGELVVVVGVRDVAGSAWTSDKKERVQIRRRFMLLGTTLDAMRVWDIRRSIAWARSLEPGRPFSIEAEGVMAQNALYASLFEEEIDSLVLHGLPSSHREGAIYLNVMRHMDMQVAAVVAAERSGITLHGARPGDWNWASTASELLGFGENFAFAGD